MGAAYTQLMAFLTSLFSAANNGAQALEHITAAAKIHAANVETDAQISANAYAERLQASLPPPLRIAA